VISVTPQQPPNKTVAQTATTIKDDLELPTRFFDCVHVSTTCWFDEWADWRDFQSLPQ